jgi:hypothetical protein
LVSTKGFKDNCPFGQIWLLTVTSFEQCLKDIQISELARFAAEEKLSG